MIIGNDLPSSPKVKVVSSRCLSLSTFPVYHSIGGGKLKKQPKKKREKDKQGRGGIKQGGKEGLPKQDYIRAKNKHSWNSIPQLPHIIKLKKIFKEMQKHFGSQSKISNIYKSQLKLARICFLPFGDTLPLSTHTDWFTPNIIAMLPLLHA